MYLHDYQMTTVRKFRTGGNYILQGPRRIGVTTMGLTYALIRASEPDTAINVMAPSQPILEHNKSEVYTLLYAAKNSRVSMFDKSLDISTNTNTVIKFTNGSSITFTNPDAIPIESIRSDNMGDLLLVDMADGIKCLYTLATHAKLAKTQCIFTHSGAMHKDSALYLIYVDSIRGKLDYTHIRIPVEVASRRQMEEYDRVIKTMSSSDWASDIELLPHKVH